jgi:hypothetical protein
VAGAAASGPRSLLNWGVFGFAVRFLGWAGVGACRCVGCRGFRPGRGSPARVLTGGGSGAECRLLGWPVLQARTQLPLLSRSPRLRSLRRFSPAIRRCSQALFRMMPRWGTRRLPRVSQAMDRSTMGRCVR